MRAILALVLLVPALMLAACGSSSSGSDGAVADNSASNSSSSSTSSSGGSTSSAPVASNTVAMTVDSGPTALGYIATNIPYVTVTVCVPGTQQCQTIDHVQVDTGSYGFRVISSVLQTGITLPAVNVGGLPLQQCGQFADGYVWGPIVSADLKIGGETAASVPIQIMGGSSFTAPTDCSKQAMGPEEDTVALFGANAILGVGLFAQDCGDFCTTTAVPQDYYTCTATACTGTTVPLSAQATNPVVLFPTDNNGVILQLPPVAATGATDVPGTLIFGISTQSNNAVPDGATVLPADPEVGTISVTYNGNTYGSSVIDSGSNGLYFDDSSIPVCTQASIAPGFYCPTSTLSLTATNQSTAGAAPVTFSIANAVQLLQNSEGGTAFVNLGAPFSSTSTSSGSGSSSADVFDWGLPFFYGRSVVFSIEGQPTPLGGEPYIAYQ